MSTNFITTSVTYLYLNQLNALYQGMYEQLKALRQLDSPRVSDQHFKYPREVILYLEQQVGKLTTETLFQVEKVDEAISAVLRRAIDFVHNDLKWWVNLLDSYPNFEAITNKVKLIDLTSLQIRACYTQAYYIKGMRPYANIMKNNELYKFIISSQEPIIKEIDGLSMMVNKIKVVPDEVDARKLVDERLGTIKMLKARLLTNINDCLILSKTLGANITPESIGISPAELRDWEAIGIKANELFTINIWRAHGFGPLATKRWWDAGVLSPILAFKLESSGVTPEEMLDAALADAKEAQEALKAQEVTTNSAAIGQLFGATGSDLVPGAEDLDS